MRSEISLSKEVGICVGTPVLRFVCMAAADLNLAAAFFLDFPEARLGAAVNLTSIFEAWSSAC